MNIQTNSNNIAMQGSKNSSWKAFKERIKQSVFDTLPSATFKDDKAVKTWKKFDEKISKPAENRLIMGASALVTQPLIDSNNKKVDEETRRVSRNRTIAKILVGTGVGICIRGSCYNLVQKMTDINGTLTYSKKLLPKDYVNKLAKEPTFLKNYRSALSTALAILVMSVTNFLIDAPLTVLLTNKLNSKKQPKANENGKEAIYG